MAEEDIAIKVYKRERTLTEMVLGRYENSRTKLVVLKQWNKKCGLLVGKLAADGKTYIYDSGIELPFEILEELTDVLPTMSKMSNAVNYAELGENKDSFGNEYRTLLKSSEYGGLKVCRMKKGPAPVDFGVSHDEEVVDPDPLAASTVTEKSPHDNWTECWDKFYINKNDDWKKISLILRDFCVAVHADLNSSTEDVVPPSPPTATTSGPNPRPAKERNNNRPLQPEISLVPATPKKRKSAVSAPKRNKKSKVVSGEEEEEEIVFNEVNYRILFFLKNLEILIVTIFFSIIQ
jgi:hypothetical protein